MNHAHSHSRWKKICWVFHCNVSNVEYHEAYTEVFPVSSTLCPQLTLDTVVWSCYVDSITDLILSWSLVLRNRYHRFPKISVAILAVSISLISYIIQNLWLCFCFGHESAVVCQILMILAAQNLLVHYCIIFWPQTK